EAPAPPAPVEAVLAALLEAPVELPEPTLTGPPLHAAPIIAPAAAAAPHAPRRPMRSSILARAGPAIRGVRGRGGGGSRARPRDARRGGNTCKSLSLTCESS